jgi:hypothetical protein
MNLETRVELQNLAWKQMKLTVPQLERLLEDYSQNVSNDLPKAPTEVAAFVNGEFKSYLEPIPGFFRMRTYSREAIEKAAGPLTSLGTNMPWGFQDSKFHLYWFETERFEFGLNITGFELHGERPLV